MTIVGGEVAYRRRSFAMRRRVSAAKLDPERAALVVIDVQEAFRKAIPAFDDVAGARRP